MDGAQPAALFVLLLGISVSLALFFKALLKRAALPDLIGYLAIGLPRASILWSGGVVASGLLGFAVPYHLLDLGLTASLFTAVAMTATSVGVAVSVYESAGALESQRGKLFLDTAELDDISGVLLMALLLAVAPVLSQDSSTDILSLALSQAGLLLLKLALFTAFCYWFALQLVPRLLRYVKQLELGVDSLLTVLAIGLAIAALAALLGFSLAIGAFFAGLVFSRDREFVRKESSLEALYDFLIPFFFIGIGIGIDPTVLVESLGMGALLIAVAFAGKMIGTSVPARMFLGWRDSLILGLSMVPHAEITMIILSRGRNIGDAVVPTELYAAGVMMVAATSIIPPIILSRVLRSGGGSKGSGGSTNSTRPLASPAGDE